MKLLSYAVAAFCAVIPASAFAVPVNMTDNGTYNLGGGETHIYEEVIGSASGTRTFTLMSGSGFSQLNGAASLLYFPGGTTSAFTVTFGGISVPVIDTGVSFVSKIASLFDGAAQKDLVVSWSGANASAGEQLSVRVSAVPVPAGVLLLGTALAGLGVVRQRRTKAVA